MTHSFKIIIACAAVAAVPAAAFGQELLVNPGFEDINVDGSFGDGWGAFGAAGFNNFFGSAEMPNGHASLFADQPGNSGGVFQTGIAGEAGTGYAFSLTDTFVEPRANANLRFGFEFYPADDATLISSALAAIDLSDQTVNHGGGLVFTTSAVAPAGTAFVRPIVSFDGSAPFTAGSGGPNIFVFDASLTAVPEPGTALLGGAAALGLLARRRRRA